jgi:hypothetical protein
MNCLCPACRRPTRIEPQLIDFFTRCDRCGILLRPRRPADMTPLDPDDPTSIELTAKIVPVGRVQERMANANGTLAELLGAERFVLRDKAPEKRIAPPVAVAAAPPVVSPAPVAAEPITAAAVMKQPRAIQRAMLRQHHHALGILGICGAGLVAVLTAAALTLKVHALGHPRSAQGAQEMRARR